MKTGFLLASAALILAPYIMAPWALAFDHPKEAYLAEYEVTEPRGKSKMFTASDGKGLAYTQIFVDNVPSKFIGDYKAETITILSEKSKTGKTEKMDQKSAKFFDLATHVKEVSEKDLGSKEIDGHPCHGYRYKEGAVTHNVWIGDDCKIIVLSESEPLDNAIKATISLKKISEAPPASSFEIPADYNIMLVK